MQIRRICGSNEFFWARCRDGRLHLCFTDLMITSRNLAPEVVVFTNSESSQDIFSQGVRQVIRACDIVKRIPRDCVCGIGIGGGMDGIQTTVRLPESELAFRKMSEVSLVNRETATFSPRREDVSKVEEFTPQKSLNIPSSKCGENLVYSMCQEILIHTLTFLDLNHNYEGILDPVHVPPEFKKPFRVTSNTRLQNPKDKVKLNSSKKKSTLMCRKLVEDLVKTLTKSRRQESNRVKYDSKGSIINIWTKCDVYPYEAQDDCVNVDGLEFRSFLSSEHLESFLSKHQARCHSVTIFESVRATPSTQRTPCNPATQAINLKKGGGRKDQSMLNDQTSTTSQLGSSCVVALTSQSQLRFQPLVLPPLLLNRHPPLQLLS